MALRQIVKEGDSVLRKKCRPVTEYNEKLWTLLDDMKETLARIENNVSKEDFLYSTINSNYEGRNVVGEAFACIKALEIAIDKGWKQVNIVFDYIGLAY